MLPNASLTRKETEKAKEGLFSRFSKSESAAVTVIIAILLLGLIFAVISIVRLHYVPEWKSEAEQDHVYNVWDDMVGVKAEIDMLLILMNSGSYSPNNFSATVPFSLGGGTVKVFEPTKSAGKLEVNGEKCTMTVTPCNASQSVNYTFECGGISCYLENREYPDQVFRYENNALILADGRNSLMRQSPAFTINETSKDNYTFTIYSVNLSGKADSISSNTVTPLQLTGWGTTLIYNSSQDTLIKPNAFNLTIATKYPGAWSAYFNETAQDKGLKFGESYKVEMPDSGSVRFSFLPGSSKKLQQLYVSKAVVLTEIPDPYKW